MAIRASLRRLRRRAGAGRRVAPRTRVNPVGWADSVLLTYDGVGHDLCSISPCVADAIGRYLMTPSTPPPGTHCPAVPPRGTAR
ncbi:alpha/beta hydrolase [Actinomadura terrae]|uniref:alpha/beta hydrolase n=1 Tax=Actinomadura terrae TaxID=604353 RepID=UPI003557D3FF